MSFNVRVAGPEFTDERSRDVFARIEESIRQFSTHSRETFSVVRSPLQLGYDHFVLVWSRGSALVALVPHGGRIRGGRAGRWITEERSEHAVSETTFENPYEAMAGQRETLEALLQSSRAVPATVTEMDLRLEDRAAPSLSLIALFIEEASEVHLYDDLNDRSFSAISLDYALSRTMFHMPNLLRLTDRGSVVYTSAEIEAATAELDASAASAHLAWKANGVGQLQSFRRARKRHARRNISLVWVIAAIAIGVVLFVILRPQKVEVGDNQAPDTATTPAAPRLSTLVIRLPLETQLVVSSQVYQTRSELDNALSHGSVIRYLPDTLHIVRTDSLTLAKGIYGYFKVNNVWRKGKLLQTFKSQDTIVVDNFLDPLK